MPNRSRKQKDTQQLARSVLDSIMPDAEPAKKKPTGTKAEKEKDPAAVALGRKGGLKGGKARAATLTKEQRSESAKKAAKARWSKSE
jgi:hypothetical protein